MIRTAIPNDASTLTEIAFAAKGFWNYPPEYMRQWVPELTISEDYIRTHIVRCKIRDSKIAGFYSIVRLENDQHFGAVTMEQDPWLDHMFILPQHHHAGIGREFFSDIDQLIVKGLIDNQLLIFVDPHAVGFYEKMGAKQIRVSNSSIPGRQIPVFKYMAQHGCNAHN